MIFLGRISLTSEQGLSLYAEQAAWQDKGAVVEESSGC